MFYFDPCQDLRFLARLLTFYAVASQAQGSWTICPVVGCSTANELLGRLMILLVKRLEINFYLLNN